MGIELQNRKEDRSANVARKKDKDIDHSSLVDLRKQLALEARDAPRAQQNEARNLLEHLQLMQDEIAKKVPNKTAEGLKNSEERSVHDLARELADKQVEHQGKRFQASAGVSETVQRGIQELNERQQREEQRHPNLSERALSKQNEGHQHQREDAARLVVETKRALLDLEARDENRLKDQRNGVSAALMPNEKMAGQREGDIRNAVEFALSKEDQDRNELRKDVSALMKDATRRFTDILERAGPQVIDRAREALGDLAHTLSDGALQRVLREGAKQPEALRKSVESAIKGQLAEELWQASQEEALKNRSDTRMQFIAGDRIRDEKNSKLTDGVLAWQDDNQLWHIEKIFEVKAGERAVKGLIERLEKMTEEFIEETQRYAVDLARENTNNKKVESSQEFRRVVDKYFKELTSHDAQRDAGQLERTAERIHESSEAPTKLYVDGKAITLARDQGRANVIGIVPKGTEGVLKAERLKASDQELTRMARHLAEVVEKKRA